MGSYAPEKRTGPALWLRCIEARVVEGAPPAGTTPMFYLPGVSREKLRAAEDCPQELAALVELQYRGVMWLHVNGKEWTPYAFLVSKHGGLGLDVAKDQATLEALAGALPVADGRTAISACRAGVWIQSFSMGWWRRMRPVCCCVG